MIYFLRRGQGDTLTCETRLATDGNGYELAISENGTERVELFESLPRMLSREHELLLAWRAQGWRDVGPRPFSSSVPNFGVTGRTRTDDTDP